MTQLPSRHEQIQIASLLLSGILANPNDRWQSVQHDHQRAAETALSLTEALFDEYERRIEIRAKAGIQKA